MGRGAKFASTLGLGGAAASARRLDAGLPPGGAKEAASPGFAGWKGSRCGECALNEPQNSSLGDSPRGPWLAGAQGMWE